MFAQTFSPGTRWPAISQYPDSRCPEIPHPIAVVEVGSDGEGLLDKEQMQTLVDCLFQLADDPASGEVVVDLSQVTSVTAQFLSVVDYFGKRLGYHNKRLTLWGIQPQCARLLQLSGIDELVDCHPAPHPRAVQRRGCADAPKPDFSPQRTRRLQR